MCRARRWMAVRLARVVGAALIHTSMSYSNTGRTKPRYTIARCFGSSTADALRRKPSRWAPRTASCRIWLRNASCLLKKKRIQASIGKPVVVFGHILYNFVVELRVNAFNFCCTWNVSLDGQLPIAVSVHLLVWIWMLSMSTRALSMFPSPVLVYS